MAFTFSVKTWRKERPSSAEGSGVADAIGKVEKACKKDPAEMSETESTAASDALIELDRAFDTAKKKITSDKKAKDTGKILGLIAGWKQEIKTGQDELRQAKYQALVAIVRKAHGEAYEQARGKFVPAYVIAERAVEDFRANGTLPSRQDILAWMGYCRDVEKICSKQSISGLSVPAAKQVKVDDVGLPDGAKELKAQAQEMFEWCEELAAGSREGAKEILDDTGNASFAEGILKGILKEYAKIEQASRPLVGRAKKIEASARQVADVVKQTVEAGITDQARMNKIVEAVVKVATLCNDTTDEMKEIHSSYRESSGELSKRTKKFRETNGYDAKTHGEKIAETQKTAFMTIREITLPLGNATTQVARVKRLLEESTNHRGYASAIPAVKTPGA